MYAVVKTGGKQYRVEVGETLPVEHLDALPSSLVTLPALLVSDGDKVLTGENAGKATVTAEVVGHGKADKVIVFKFKKRKGYKRTRGHRQNLTLLKVTDIALAGAKKAAKAKAVEAVATETAVEKPAVKKTAAKPVVKKTGTAAVEKKPTAKKPVAKKIDGEVAVKKPAAKKPAAKKTTTPPESAE